MSRLVKALRVGELIHVHLVEERLLLKVRVKAEGHSIQSSQVVEELGVLAVPRQDLLVHFRRDSQLVEKRNKSNLFVLLRGRDLEIDWFDDRDQVCVIRLCLERLLGNHKRVKTSSFGYKGLIVSGKRRELLSDGVLRDRSGLRPFKELLILLKFHADIGAGLLNCLFKLRLVRKLVNHLL